MAASNRSARKRSMEDSASARAYIAIPFDYDCDASSPEEVARALQCDGRHVYIAEVPAVGEASAHLLIRVPTWRRLLLHGHAFRASQCCPEERPSSPSRRSFRSPFSQYGATPSGCAAAV